MSSVDLLRLAAEFRQRAAAVSPPEKADLLFLAEEYEAAAGKGLSDKQAYISVKLPK
jgi:hypothetical protein